MASCVYCNAEFTFMENITNRLIQRCKQCDGKMKAIQKSIFTHMEQMCQHQGFSEDIAIAIQGQLHAVNMPMDLSAPVIQRLHHYRDLALKDLQQKTFASIERAFRHDGVSAEMETAIKTQFSTMKMPHELSAPVIQRLLYYRNLTMIRLGNVPRIPTSIHLDSDEYAHFDLRVTYYKPTKNIKTIPGRLIGTNKKCYFISDTGADNATLDWNNVTQTHEQTMHIPHKSQVNGKTHVTHQSMAVLHLSVAKGSGGGGYWVPDILYTKTIIDTLVRMWKRQLVLYAEQKEYGSIPEHVKKSVFQRDGGRCVQCADDLYIEYDHKQPRSKGGQNTVENIQLLCRNCNLKKGNRV